MKIHVRIIRYQGIFFAEFHFGRRGTRYSGNREESGYRGTGLKVAMLCRDC